MSKNKLHIFCFCILSFLISFPVSARCAVCYTKGMSGASIAVIVIIASFIILFVGNKLIQKIVNKD